jgi:hypothetical protein
MDKCIIKKASSSKRTIQEVDDDTADDVVSRQNMEYYSTLIYNN